MTTIAEREPRTANVDAFVAGAQRLLGREFVLTDDASRRLYSTDFSEIPLAIAKAILRPHSRDEIVLLVQLARETGVMLTARGGGMSYTLGYAPRDENSAILDMTRMRRIELRPQDKLAIVEPGVTWAELAEALRPTGFQIGCMGTMSGIAATIGGGLGNNATGHGRGDITDDLMGLEIVSPRGEIVLTGALATNPENPVLRSYGPDFTGVFTHDAGAFGVKTKAAFRLMRRPEGVAYVCYGFNDAAKLVAALCDAERLDVMASNMAFSHYHHRVFAGQKPSPDEAKAMAKLVLSGAPSPLRGLADLATLARPGGMNYLLDWQFSTFGIIYGFDQHSADRMAAAAATAMRKHGGVKLPTGLGVVMRAQPYMPIEKLMIGIDGECTIPTNCGVVLSQAQELTRIVGAFFDANAAGMKQHGVTWTQLFLTSKGGFGIEPIIYWRDRPNPLRLSKVAEARRGHFESLDENLPAREYAVDLRRRLVTEVDRLHPYHFQIGKYYDYRAAVASPAAWRLLEDFKSNIDPDGFMNPGALGL